MTTLARVTTFTTGTTISSVNVNAELDQLVGALNGTGMAHTVTLLGTGAGTTLSADNTGGGKVASFLVSGVEKLLVNTAGQLESVLTTGTAPFIVASTTEVANLNAASVGGTLASNLAKLDSANTFVVNNGWNQQELESDTASQILFKDTAAGSVLWPYIRIRSAAKLLRFAASADNTTYVDIARLNAATKKLQVDKTVDGNDWSDVASEAYVEGKTTAWSFGVFYAGGVDTGIVQAIWVVPNDVDTILMDRIRWVFQSGTPTGTTQIKLQHKNALGVEQNTQTISILVGDTALNSYEVNVADWTLLEGEFLQWTIVADGGHQDISIHAQGTQTLI